MIIVAGHVTVDAAQREMYLAGCVIIVEQARQAAGCLDVVISADLLDPTRVNLYERWESQAALDTFRRNGPAFEYGDLIRSTSVAEYIVAEERELFAEGDASAN